MKKNRRRKRRSSRVQPGVRLRAESASGSALRVTWAQGLCAGAIALFAAAHLASIVVEFQTLAGLHRWFMTYAEGFHRRGLVGTIFQFLVGDRPREAQIELASQISSAATWLWLAASFGLFVFTAMRARDRAVLWVALAFAAFVLINPMWTTRIHDNGYLDWLSGLAVLGGLAAFIYKRPVLSGTLVAVAVIGYWGTIFVWLPLAFLITCLLARDAMALPEVESSPLSRILATWRRREVFALLLPLVSGLLTTLLHDNDAALAELQRIGGQENIIRETFSGIGPAVIRQVEALLQGWRTYLGIATVFVFPAALCAGLWVCVMRRLGFSMFQRAWLDIGVAVVATLSPLTFLVVAFDLSRLMGWTYFGFFVVAVFWLSGARAAPRPSAIWPWTTVPLVLAVFFWTTPTIYAWVDLSRLLKCERFCFKEQTPQGRALDLFRRRAIAPPIWEFTAPGFLTPGQTGYNEKSDDGNNQIRIARAGRDEPGSVMDLNFAIDDKVEGVTVRAPEQTQRAIIGAGAHRIAISYRSAGVETSNAETRFYVYDSRWTHSYEFFRMPLSASETEFTVTFTPPPDLAGNSFRWTIHYTGVGVFELREVTFLKVGEET